ncbi:DNA polymerase III subunit delta' [Bogoriella caseilytica]|uniref:DNA polymerase-3 subunit delta n=1 Tax=Bogoriella caseilytica TaxID=56055 RepID=A0A3N2BD93_9MICO|nr:DNA polymerase III subunit delta' [Bogoriella caseilytica]ROR73221.1 DNA polymerase-3 subunit delta' [Bogoriella caseilytica]
MSVWDDVIGQESAVSVLQGAARDPQAMSHAWLITGPPGSGRSVAARAFAAALQCTEGGGPGANEPGCGRCHACTTTMNGSHADVSLVTTEKVIFSIEEIRPLVSEAQRAPAGGRWRIMLMEDADRMVERTSNVLLKAIEEPPPRTVWLLCAPSPEDVLTTIRSRCRPVHLRVPDAHAVAELLVRRDGVDPEEAIVAARAAQSHVGMARRLAHDPAARDRRRRLLTAGATIRGVGDAVLAAAELVDLAAQDAAAATAERAAAERADLLRTLGAEEDAKRLPPALRAQVRQLEEDQKRRATRAQRDVLDRAMVDLLSLYRDVLVVQNGAGVALINADLDAQIRRLAQESSTEQTVRRMDAVGEARQRLAGNVAPLLAVEAMMVALRPQPVA